jgi:acetyltransferase-like isoleucine patch superfamily enzyme
MTVQPTSTTALPAAAASQSGGEREVVHKSTVTRVGRLLRRFAVPGFVVRLIYFWRFRALVSPRAEVEWAPGVDWGRGCVVSSFTKIKINGPFRLGRRVHIASGCFIEVSAGGLTVGDDVLVGPNCSILTSKYVYDRVDLPLHLQGHTSDGVVIGRNVWIGANAVVLDGARLGDGTIVAAGSVVSGQIPPGSIVQGNPARVIFTRR